MRHSDRPITHPGEDLLERGDFALALAQSIDNLKLVSNGFVIGLIGPWGSGKSSVVELTLRYLKHIEMQRLSGACNERLTLPDLDSMADQFLRVKPSIDSYVNRGLDVNLWDRRHSSQEFLRACRSAENAELAERYWSLTKRLEQSPRNIVIRFSPWLIAGNAELASALLSDMARVLGEKLGQEVQDAFAALLDRLSQVAPLAGAAVDATTFGAFGGLFAAGIDLSSRFARRLTTGPTLENVRERLRIKLRALDGYKIVVVIDDLDRLTPSEAVEMVSLVKGLGDLPNVLYLLCYDEMRLADLIKCGSNLDGSQFLEKIIQYPVHVPPVDAALLSRMIDKDLGELLGTLDNADSQRLSVVWFNIIRHYVQTPRDARRLVNAFSVAIAGLGDHTDSIDLLVLETIRVNEPSIYNWLRQNLDQLVK